MGMSFGYGAADQAVNMRVLHRYVELGGNFIDTAEMYGPFANEELIGRFLREVKRDQLVVATKFGFKIDPKTRQMAGMDSSPETLRSAVEGSLKRLGVETIDLLYQHRVDPMRPIEETVGVMAELVKAGKVRALGLSEAGSETLKKAYAVHPIAALQSEYSLWTRDPETTGTLATCRALGIGFVAYSPLGRGFLTGTIQKKDDLAANDWRRQNPRFQDEAIEQNKKLSAQVEANAAKKGCTPAQLAIAWVLAQGDDVVPIPGTKRVKYLEDNLGALKVTLSKDELAELDRMFPPGAASGTRYAEAMMSRLNA